jgi:hypothetical protein
MPENISPAPFPVGAAVEFVRVDVARDVWLGDVGTVVESFAPDAGRNVQLADGRTVNVPTSMLRAARTRGGRAGGIEWPARAVPLRRSYDGRPLDEEDPGFRDAPPRGRGRSQDQDDEQRRAAWDRPSGTYREQLGQLVDRYAREARVLRTQGRHTEARHYAGMAEGLRIARRVLPAEFMG